MPNGYNILYDDRGESMTLDLKRIFATDGAVLPIEYELDMSMVDRSGAFPLNKPVKVVGAVTNKADVVSICLEMSYEYCGACDRCGTDTSRVYRIPFERALAVSIEGEESDTIITVPDMKLDLEELIFTEVYVSLPTKFLCREDCKGLCCECGKNLNQGSCECSKEEIDPRFAKLKELLNQ